MIGTLLYLPTTTFVGQYFFLLAFIVIFIRNRKQLLVQYDFFLKDPSHPVNWNFLLVVCFVILATLNRIIHWDQVDDINTAFPFFVLAIPTYIIAISLRRNDFKVLILWIVVEAGAVLLQRALGITTFDASSVLFKEIGEGGLLYDVRPLGFSPNSSNTAVKFMIAWLLIDFVRFKERYWIVVKFLLLIGIFLTFNRSVLVSMIIYLVIYLGYQVFKGRYKLENAVIGLIGALFGGGVLIYLFFSKFDSILNQLTRNTGGFEITGRQYIWRDFIQFIQENLFFGNSSIKLWLDGYHAHNSYLQVIATHGLLISLVVFALIYRNVRLSNWMFVLPILILGLSQYVFFWGISLMDIVFYSILFIPARSLIEQTTYEKVG